ncbi:MAG: putative quinol monooxygenase [Gammaproteobacteria bacterium]|nr:putative quinol monooxygenase [Gammaproteobacteria bacterium]
MQDVTVLVHLRLRPDGVVQGKRDLLEFARRVKRLEPDCLAIEIVQDLDEPTKITMIEKWSDREAYEGPHLQTPHMRAFVERSGKYFDGPAQIAFCHATVIGREDQGRGAPYGR